MTRSDPSFPNFWLFSVTGSYHLAECCIERRSEYWVHLHTFFSLNVFPKFIYHLRSGLLLEVMEWESCQQCKFLEDVRVYMWSKQAVSNNEISFDETQNFLIVVMSSIGGDIYCKWYLVWVVVFIIERWDMYSWSFSQLLGDAKRLIECCSIGGVG